MSDRFYLFRKKGKVGDERDTCQPVLKTSEGALVDITKRLEFQRKGDHYVANVKVGITGARSGRPVNVRFFVGDDGELGIKARGYELEEVSEEEARDYNFEAQDGRMAWDLSHLNGVGKGM